MHPGTDVLSQGDAMFTAKNFAGAADAYRQVVTQNPMLGAGWAKLTVALTAMGDYAAAVDAGAKSVVFAPRELDAKYGYAYSLVRLERYRDAVDQLDEILAENTHRDDARNLLLWSLQQAGDKLSADDPHEAERFLDRAHKLRPESPEPVVSLLNLYADSQQFGKITRLIGGMPKQLQDPTIASALQKLSDLSPEVKRAVDQGVMAARSQGPAVAATPAAGRPTVQYVPCPSCKRSVADFAAICPHCGHQIRATGTFANRDTGPAYAWQDIALTGILILNILFDVAVIFLAWQASKGQMDFLFQFTAVIFGASAVLSLACVFRNEIALNVLKYLLYFQLLRASLGLVMGLMLARWLDAAVNLAVLCVGGFLLYLIHWASD